MHFSNYVCVCFKFAVDLPVMERKEIASDKLATAVTVSVVLLLFVTIITAIIILVVIFAFIRKKYKHKGNYKDFKEQEMDTNGQLQFENEDKKEFEVTSTCSEAKEIIPTSIGLTTADED